MKKLSDIPKKNIFEVPEGYFEKLPGVIQARVASKESSAAWSWSWSTSLRYALPAVVIAVAGIFWFRSGSNGQVDFQKEIASIAPEQVQEYLDQHDWQYDTDMSTEEVVENSDWNKKDIDGLEKSVYSEYGATKQEIDQALDELDSEL